MLLVEDATGKPDGIYLVVAVLIVWILYIEKTCRHVFFCTFLTAQFMDCKSIGVDFLSVALTHLLVGFEGNKFQ